MLTEREITLARVALLQKLSRILNGGEIVGASPSSIDAAERYNEIRDLVIKLGKMRVPA